jgi:phage gp29-like protein
LKDTLKKPALSIRTKFAVRQAERALRNLEHGDFAEADMLADLMTRDERIASALETRVNALTSLPVRVKPAEISNKQAATRAAKILEKTWKNLVPKPFITQVFYNLLKTGICPLEINWNRKTWTPEFEFWAAQHVIWDEHNQAYQIQSRDGMLDFDSSNPTLHMLAIATDRPWMMSMVRSLAVPYLVRKFAVEDWARYSEVHGNPIPKATLPPGDEKDVARKAFKSQIATLGARTTLYTPTGNTKDDPSYDFELVEAMGDSTETFDRLIAVMSDSIAIRILGQNMTTSGQANQNGVTGANKVRQDLLESDANLITDLVHEHILKPWALLHFGDVELAPTLEWDAVPPEDKTARATALNTIADAATKLQALGVNVKPILESYDLEVGIVPPVPDPTPPPDPNVKPDAPVKPVKAQAFFVPEAKNDPFADGQKYADDLVRHAEKIGLLESDLTAVLEAVASAENYDDLENRLLEVFTGMNAEDMAGKLESALVLAQMAGQHVVREET